MHESSPDNAPERRNTAHGSRSDDAAQAQPDVRGAQYVPVQLDDSRMDPDAIRVVRRLTRHGHVAYLVGGGIRDLLLGCRPKDFDVATDARPEQVRRLFRNSRVIGRRFRLAHVVFAHGKVIEVATFRRNPEPPVDDGDNGVPNPEELLIRSDNAFGEPHEDARRRDLTINALFYDVDTRQVIDFVGGMNDIRRRVVRTIGDPEVRFLEDPVRMVRAIKFASRLDLGMDPDLYDAIVRCRGAITQSARPRLLEEVLKVLRCGGAHRAFWLMWETGLLHVIAPELGTWLDEDAARDAGSGRVWRILQQVDRMTAQQGRPLPDLTLLTVLLLPPLNEAVDGHRDRTSAALEYAEPLFARLAIPRRLADGISRTVAALPRIASGRPGRFARSELYPVAVQVESIDRAAST